MGNPAFVKNYNASGTIPPYTIVKFDGTTDGSVVASAAVTDGLLGVSTDVGVASGQPVDICHGGITDVKLGGTVTLANLASGVFLTSDANGNGVVAAPSAGVNNNVIGKPLHPGVSGDVISVLISPDSVQG